MTETALVSLIGNTPLIHLDRLSRRTGCNILGKAEFMNPGGSVKDRTAWGLIRDAEQRGVLSPGGHIYEGTAGNTGIGLTLIANARGYKTTIVMPETQSAEKIAALRMIGANLELVPAVPQADAGHYTHVARRMAEQAQARGEPAFWAQQFDNLANRQIHAQTTGPEIWLQTGGMVDAFCCAVGTGGTLSGVAQALRQRLPEIKIFLTDPMGAALYHYYTEGVLKSEGSSITEGIGQSRVTENLAGLEVDGAFQIPDDEALSILFEVLKYEGLCLGTSSGINLAGACRVAEQLGPGHTIVTVLCDSGSRYQSKLFNPSFLRSKGLPVPAWLAD